MSKERLARGLPFAAAVLVLAFLAAFLGWPLLKVASTVIGNSTMAAGDLPAGAAADAAWSTLRLAATGTALSLALGLPASWAASRARAGGRIISIIVTAPFALPTVVVALAFATLARRAHLPLGAETLIVLALAFFNMAVVVRTVTPVLEGIDWRLVAAAKSLGAAPASVARHIMWPTLRRPIANAALIIFAFCSSSFAIVLVLGGTKVQTLETTAYVEVTTYLNLRGAAALALLQAAIVAVTMVVASFTSRTTVGREPPAASQAYAPARSAGAAFLAAPALILVTVPLLSLTATALRTDTGTGLGAFSRLTDAGVAGMSGSVADAAINSILLATGSAAIAMVAALAALVAHAHRRTRWVTGATLAPIAVSSLVVGLGLMLTFGRLRTQGTVWSAVLLMIAQALVALPLVVRVALPAVSRIDPWLLKAARTLGASRLDTVRAVVWPLSRRGLASAAVLGWSVALGEFGASTFLVRPNAPTLPTLIVRVLSRPGPDQLATAAAAALLLAAITGAAMAVAESGGRRRRVY